MYPADTMTSIPAVAEEVRNGPVERAPVQEISWLDHSRLDVVGVCAIEGLDAGAVREHESDPWTADGVVEEGLQVRPGTGNEHRDPLPHGRGHATRATVHAGRTLST